MQQEIDPKDVPMRVKLQAALMLIMGKIDSDRWPEIMASFEYGMNCALMHPEWAVGVSRELWGFRAEVWEQTQPRARVTPEDVQADVEIITKIAPVERRDEGDTQHGMAADA